jgi:plasmid maintenance system antidote protein VapI
MKTKKMKTNEHQKENEAWDMFSTPKLVEDLMKRDGLTVDFMAEKTGKPVQYFIEIIRHVRDINQKDALLFERCFGWSAIELIDHQTRDSIAKAEVRRDIRKIWVRLLELEVEWPKVEAELEKLLALTEKMFPAHQRSSHQFVVQGDQRLTSAAGDLQKWRIKPHHQKLTMNIEFERAKKRTQQESEIEGKKIQKVLQALPPGALTKFFMELNGPRLDTVAKEVDVPVQHIIEMIEHKRPVPPKIANLLEQHYGWSAKASLEQRRKIAEFNRVIEAERQRREEEDQLRDLMSMMMAVREILKNNLELLKLLVEIRELEATEKTLRAHLASQAMNSRFKETSVSPSRTSHCS